MNLIYCRFLNRISISITGIAGPKGGSKQKPIGLVYIGIKKGNKTIVKKIYLKIKKENQFKNLQ